MVCSRRHVTAQTCSHTLQHLPGPTRRGCTRYRHSIHHTPLHLASSLHICFSSPPLPISLIYLLLRRRLCLSSRYREELLVRSRCQEHEMFDQPVAMVLVASSTDDNPVQCFDRLARSDNLPLVYVLWSGRRVGGCCGIRVSGAVVIYVPTYHRLFVFSPSSLPPVSPSSPPLPPPRLFPVSPPSRYRRGLYDSSVAKFYLLLHDNCEGGRADNQDHNSIFRKMKTTFPAANCFRLCINSLSATSPNMGQVRRERRGWGEEVGARRAERGGTRESWTRAKTERGKHTSPTPHFLSFSSLSPPAGRCVVRSFGAFPKHRRR